VLIDKMRERSLRPSALIAHLQSLQDRPIRFKPEAFLESLYKAYALLVKARGQDGAAGGAVIPLADIHQILTLLPGTTREYSRQEFGRDLYLLDQSGVQLTREGFMLSFHASTGTRSLSKTIRIIGREGQEKKYYGIAFVRTKGE
jgi:hypothetical protein